MKKSNIFLILMAIFFTLSLIIFNASEKELINPVCKPNKCNYQKYTDAFVKPAPMCTFICTLNPDDENFIVHGYSYVPLVWLGVFSLITSLIYYSKEQMKK